MLQMKNVIVAGIVLGMTSLMGCSAQVDENVGNQSEAILSGLTLATFDSSAQVWNYDTDGDGVWTTGVDFASAAAAFGGTGDIALSGSGLLSTCSNYGGGIGVYRPSTRQFFLDTNRDGVWSGTATDRLVNNFLPAATGFTDQPLIWSKRTGGGDFPTCQGVIGFFRTPDAGGAGVWFIDINDNGVWDGAGIDLQATWGVTGDVAVPLSGGPRLGSRLTIFKPSTGQWLEDNGSLAWDGCAIDSCAIFGNPNTKPFGNPNGVVRGISDGSSKFLDANNSGVWDAGDASYTFGVAAAQPIIF